MEEIGIFLVCGVIGFVTARFSVVLRHTLYGSFDEVLPFVIILGAIALYLGYGAAPCVGKLATSLQWLVRDDIDFALPDKGIVEKMSWRDIDAMFFALPVAGLMAFIIDSAVLLPFYLSTLDPAQKQHGLVKSLLALPILLSPLILIPVGVLLIFSVLVVLLISLVTPLGELPARLAETCSWHKRANALEVYKKYLLEEMITEEGDDFYRLQLKAAREKRPLMVTLTNHRLYYGVPLLEPRQPQLISSHGASRQLQMELIFSGYRDETAKAVNLTVVYPRKEFSLIEIPYAQIVSMQFIEEANLLKHARYEDGFKQALEAA